MASWVHVAAGKQPDRVAVECGERAITYAELARHAAATAPRHERVVLENDDRFEFALALHGCLAAGATAVPIDTRLSEDERALRRAQAEVRPSIQGVATVMHSSGTTSVPKPVELTYANWLASALGSAVALGLDPAERWLCPMPLTHVGGLSILIRSTIYATSAVLHDGFDTEAVLRDLLDPARGITMVSLVPTMLSRLLEAGLRRPPTLRWALLGGAPIPSELIERATAAGVPVAPTYGMTEGCSQLFTFGLPLPGLEFRLAGRDREILVRGPMVAPGAVDEDGWLHTGDLGRTDAQGRLAIVGRRSNTIISGGENVAPEEVEGVLGQHPGVVDVAVVGRPDPEWGEVVVALVISGEELDPDQLRAYCRTRLAAFKVPKLVEFVDGLPRTNSGKLLRRQLR